MKRLLIIIALVFFPLVSLYSEQNLLRKVIVLYKEDGKKTTQKTCFAHRFLEMPLNFLGITVQYHDLNKGFPKESDLEGVRGVLTWFEQGFVVDDPETYLDWLSNHISSDFKVVIFGNPGFGYTFSKKLHRKKIEFYQKLGFKTEGNFVLSPYKLQFFYNDYLLAPFERSFDDSIYPYEEITPIKGKGVALAQVKNLVDHSLKSTLVGVSQTGGFVAENYAMYNTFDHTREYIQWKINPFHFLELAFDIENFPAPDVTTLAGRRIFYSHIDGDGWNNIILWEKKKHQKKLSAELLYEEIFTKYVDFPVSVGAIGADISVDWVASKQSQEIAKKIFLLSHIEAASHTFSHPFYWMFFENYTPSKEEVFLPRYPNETFGGFLLDDEVKEEVESLFLGEEEKIPDIGTYNTPRAFAVKPFNLDLEVEGAIKEVEKYTPKGKKATLYLWSGDTTPFLDAIKKTKEIDVKNLNGGDPRFDLSFLSYGWVCPIGIDYKNGIIQIYASSCNEVIYTHEWKRNFYGLYKVLETYENTEIPLRIKPINLYYHAFIVEKLGGFNSLIDILNRLRNQSIIPIDASRYASIAEGFFYTKIKKVNENSWKILSRGDLQTIRFGKSSLKSVNFNQSKGVVGQIYFHGSLYVYLDEKVKEPIISLKETLNFGKMPKEDQPYLIESRWRVWNFKREFEEFSFDIEGFGKGHMTWFVPNNGIYLISIGGEEREIEVRDNFLKITLDRAPLESLHVRVVLQ